MDLDFKYSGASIDDDVLLDEIKGICFNSQDSNIKFSCLGIEDIRAEEKYAGKSVKIEARFFNIRKRFSIDIALGDAVTPYPILRTFENPFVSGQFNILSYSVETIIAEKFETLVSKGTNNSRSKDLLDLYLLGKNGYDKESLNYAMANTFFHRGTPLDKEYVKDVTARVFSFFRIRELYENYSRKNRFASNISFEMCCDSIQSIFEDIVYETPIQIRDYNIELHLVRHGEDERDKVGGWSDNHLTQEGKAQIKNLLDQLDNDYDLLVSSDLIRAKESAEIIGGYLGASFIYDDAFRETNNGDLKDLTVSEFKSKYPGLYYASLKEDECYPNGESPSSFCKRVTNAFLHLLEDNRNKKILLVTHGGVISVILCCIHGIKYSNKLRIAPPTGSITKEQ